MMMKNVASKNNLALVEKAIKNYTLLLLKSHKCAGQTKDKITKEIKSYFWEHDISHVPLILCENKGILGRDIVCQRDCYFQIKLQFPAGAKNFINSHQILYPFYLTNFSQTDWFIKDSWKLWIRDRKFVKQLSNSSNGLMNFL